MTGATVDLARITKAGAWHFVDEHVADGELGPAVVNVVCGGTRDALELELGVDALVIRHRGSDVCGNCRSIHTYRTHNPGTEPEKEDVTMATTTAPRTRKSSSSSRSVKKVTKQELEKAIKRADRAIATQPKRTTADLTKRQAEKAFVLGKGISADRWRLSLAKPGVSSSSTIAGMVERIEARVAERNALRTGA